MLERRKIVRFEPRLGDCAIEIEAFEGVVSDISAGGICVIVPADVEFIVGQHYGRRSFVIRVCSTDAS